MLETSSTWRVPSSLVSKAKFRRRWITKKTNLDQSSFYFDLRENNSIESDQAVKAISGQWLDIAGYKGDWLIESLDTIA